jgi:hypothetical protein
MVGVPWQVKPPPSKIYIPALKLQLVLPVSVMPLYVPGTAPVPGQVKLAGAPTAGGVRDANGFTEAGVLNVGHESGVTVHVTVPPAEQHVPETPKVPALTVSAFPAVLKLPLSLIPQVLAFRVAFPLMLTPSMLAAGAPNVYKQPPPFAPPLTFVATARAVIASLLTPKILMKYVG